MKKCALRILTLLCSAGAMIMTAKAQVDPHFSQYYIHPMNLNPALTGAIEGDYRVSGIWRSQYNNTLTTAGISGEVVTNKNCNFGFNLLNQATNDRAYNYTNGYLTMAYTGVRLGPNADHYVVMALQGGFINRRFDITKLQFGDQWTSGVGYDPTVQSDEAFRKPSVSSFDAGAGILYYDAVPGKKFTFFGGFSAFHITRPEDPFLSSGTKQRMPVRYSVHAGTRIIASDLVTVVPTVVYMREGNAQEKMLGAYLQIYATENTDLMIGANWRLNDAASPFAGIYYKGLTLGISYDVSVSSMAASSIRSNSLEISVSYVGKRKNSIKTNPFYCPRF